MAKIKINTSYKEYSNTLYHRNFTILPELPQEGDLFEGETITKVEKVRKDPEQPTSEAEKYDPFKIITEDAKGEESTYYIAVHSMAPVGEPKLIVQFEHLVPNMDIAEMLIRKNIKGSPLGEALWDEGMTFLEECLRIDEMEFNTALIDTTLTGSIFQPFSCSPNTYISTGFGLSIYRQMPYWWSQDDALIISAEEITANSPSRNLSDLDDKVVAYIVENMLEAAEYHPNEDPWSAWIGDEGYPSWFGLISANTDDVVRIAQQLSDVITMAPKEMLMQVGISGTNFCQRYLIPLRTYNDWNKNGCKPYTKMMIAELLGLIERKKIN